MKKRLLSTLLILAMLIGMLPIIVVDVEATATPIKTNLELVDRAINVVNNYKTLYVMGGWGQPLTNKNKERLINAHKYNQDPTRAQMINNASSDTIAFDCVCFIKSLLWGWDGDLNHPNGGANYGSNGVPDKNADQMIQLCYEVSSDFSNIEIGEVVWTDGHVGIYIGNGLAIESTPSWENCLQITACNKQISGYNTRTWKTHGKLPYIEYQDPMTIETYRCYGELKIIQEGANVKSLPCSEVTSADSKTIELAKKGSVYTAISLVRNIPGNLWYKVTAKNGQTGYIYSGDTEFKQLTTDLSVSGVAVPSVHKRGQPFGLRGIIRAKYQNLYKVGAWVDTMTG
jgi:hypothetical protein